MKRTPPIRVPITMPAMVPAEREDESPEVEVDVGVMVPTGCVMVTTTTGIVTDKGIIQQTRQGGQLRKGKKEERKT